MRIGELLTALTIAIVKEDLLEPLLQQHPKRGGAQLPQSLTSRLPDAGGE